MNCSNDLLDELNIEGQNNLDQKNRFYFTTQIAFGAVQVYKLQIDKLFSKLLTYLFSNL